MSSTLDYFELLEISMNANTDEVNLAFNQKIERLELWTWNTDAEIDFYTYVSKVELRTLLQNARDILNHPELKSFYIEYIKDKNETESKQVSLEQVLEELFEFNIQKVLQNHYKIVENFTKEYLEYIAMTKIMLNKCTRRKRKEVLSHYDNLLLEFEIGLINLRQELDLEVIIVQENLQKIVDSKL
jgi:hypothetical protein